MPPSATAPLPGIEHVVVLMLENRSFDNMLGGLGAWYPAGSGFDGVPAGWSNPDTENKPVAAWQDPPPTPPPYTMPDPDPGESFDDMTHQIFGYEGTLNLPRKPVGTPLMDGFVINYQHLHRGSADHLYTMHYFNPDSVPITSLLAYRYAVSDAWHAAAPNQTYPNRVFAHCGTPGLKDPRTSFVNDVDYFYRHLVPNNVNKAYGVIGDLSVLEALDLQYPGGGAANWKVYYHDSPLSALVEHVDQAWGSQDDPGATSSTQVVHYDDSDYGALPSGYPTFAADVDNDALPKYAFIEPRYYANWNPNNLAPNSNHPGPASPELFGIDLVANGNVNSKGPNNDVGISVLDGERLLLGVYLTLAANRAVFDKTLLVVTYDEAGGIFDHVPPPAAVSPFADPSAVSPFAFDRYGVRVPTLFVNPRIAAQTIFRAPASGPPLDHTSLIRTLFEQFALSTGRNGQTIDQLTPRDGGAPSLAGLIAADAEPTHDRIDPQELQDRLSNCS